MGFISKDNQRWQLRSLEERIEFDKSNLERKVLKAKYGFPGPLANMDLMAPQKTTAS